MGDVTRTVKFVALGEDRTASRTFKNIGRNAQATEGKLSSMGKRGGKAFGLLKGAALAFVGSEAVSFAKDAVDAYSELEDSTAAAAVIFGKSMNKIIKQSETASSKLGMTKQQVINAANVFGTYGKSAGLSGNKLAGFSTKMTKLAGDMASFKGTSPEQAIEAVGAALRGETEPIRAYGVMLDDATLKAQAMKMGLIKTTKEGLTPQQKVLAVQAQILKQTKDAQGDFARTSTSTANTAKTASAKWADFQAMLGQKMAPAFTMLTQKGIQLLDWLQQNPKVTKGAAAAWDLFTMALGGLWEIVRKLVLPALSLLLEYGVRPLVKGLQFMFDALGSVPGFDWAKDAAKKLGEVDSAIGSVDEALMELSKDPVNIDVNDRSTKKLKAVKSEIKGLKDKIVTAKTKGDDKELKRLERALKKAEKEKHILTATIHGRLDPKSDVVRLNIGRGGKTGIMKLAATGGWRGPGFITTGEYGRETVFTSRGAYIATKAESDRLMAGGNLGRTGSPSGGRGTVVNVIFAPKVDRLTDTSALMREWHRALLEFRRTALNGRGLGLG